MWTTVFRLNLKSRLQYRVDFATYLGIGILHQVSTVLFVGLVVHSMPELGGWPVEHVFFLTAFRLLVHALYIPLFDNIRLLPELLRTGELDSLLLRPAGVYFQVTTQSVNTNGFGDLVVAVVVFGYAQHAAGLHWDLTRAAVCAVLLLCGVVVEGAIRTALATWAFWLGHGSDLDRLADEILNNFANYPLSLFGSVTRALLTFVLPVAMLAYYPSAALLTGAGRRGLVEVTAVALFCASLSAAVAAALWHTGLRRYQSAGG